MKKLTYTTLMLLSGIVVLFAKAAVKYDSLRIEVRKFSRPPSKVYTGKDFIYKEPIEEPNFFERAWAWLKEQIYKILEDLFNWDIRAKTPGDRKLLWIVLTILLIVLMVIGLIFFLKKFSKNLGRNDDTMIVEEAERNIKETDFDTLIAEAYKGKNYRLAIRFYYLKILKLLFEHELIQYEYQKTNYEYSYEIKNEELKSLFKEVSFVFDYCWYGDHQAEESDFIIAEKKCIEIEKLILNL